MHTCASRRSPAFRDGTSCAVHQPAGLVRSISAQQLICRTKRRTLSGDAAQRRAQHKVGLLTTATSVSPALLAGSNSMAHLAHHPAPRRMQKGGQPEAEREHWLEERLFGRAPRTAHQMLGINLRLTQTIKKHEYHFRIPHTIPVPKLFKKGQIPV